LQILFWRSSVTDNNEEYVIVWEAPVIKAPEFRLYYDDKGHVICYTCDVLEGDYILIDSLTFAEARPDVRVAEGRLIRAGTGSVISRLYPGNNGIMCEQEDISIVTDKGGQFWELKTYELR
jgi:hypothetical protein